MKSVVPVPLVVFAVALSACIAPPLPEAFRVNASKFLAEASTLSAMTKHGVSFIRYNDQFAVVEGAYGMMESSWPDGFAPEARKSLAQAMEGWRLTLLMWKIHIDRLDNPTEPNVNGYLRFIDYAGPHLVLREYPPDFFVAGYRGKRYLPAKENIGVLMAVAASHFREGRSALVSAMKAKE